MTTIDTIRATFTYLIATIVVVGGGAILFVSRSDPNSSNLSVVVAGFIGSSLTFVFGSEVQTRTARQAASATSAAAVVAADAAAAATNGHSTPAAR